MPILRDIMSHENLFTGSLSQRNSCILSCDFSQISNPRLTVNLGENPKLTVNLGKIQPKINYSQINIYLGSFIQ